MSEEADYKEAAVNAMAAQVVYGDDDLKRDMEEFVVAAVVKALHSMDTQLISAVANTTWQPMANQIIVNRAREIEKIAQLVKPVGGGGTRVSCVAEYVREKQYKPKATIILTDGWIESSYEAPEGQLLWGVVDNDRFVPSKGKAVRIYSEVTI